jgi:hypothetical protein
MKQFIKDLLIGSLILGGISLLLYILYTFPILIYIALFLCVAYGLGVKIRFHKEYKINKAKVR